MADRRLILESDESLQLPNRMDQEMASAMNRALFHQQTLADIRIMNARSNARGAVTAIAHQNAAAEMAVQYPDIIITAARTVQKEVVDVQGNETWDRPDIHAVPVSPYMGKGTESLQNMREEFEAENESGTIGTEVRCLANPLTMRESRQN